MELQEHTDTDNPVAQLAQTVKAGELGIDETWPSRFLIGLMQLSKDSPLCTKTKKNVSA